MRKKDSICSRDRPLVSGTQQPVNTRLTKQMAAKKKKGTWRPKALCGWKAGLGHREKLLPQAELMGPAGSNQPCGASSGPSCVQRQLPYTKAPPLPPGQIQRL